MDNQNISRTSSSSDSKPVVISFCVISAVMIFLVYAKNILFGSKAGNWDYPYFDTIRPIPVWIPLAVLLLLGILVLVGSKLIHSYEKITLAGGFVIAFVLQSLIHRVYPYSMGRTIESDLANSFYTPAMSYSPAEILS